MTTRSGLSYKAEMDGDTPTGATTTAATGVADRELIDALMEDRTALQAHVETLIRVVEHSRSRDEEALAARTAPNEPKLTRFSEATNDIEAYLTTFERLMTAHHVDTGRWAYLLAPQLTGKAQQAFAAIPATSSGDYSSVKEAILRRYDINEETYRRRFRAAVCAEEESYQELAVRLIDLLTKWMKDYKSDPKKVLEQIAIEQLLTTLPRDVQIHVRERKTETVLQAGQLADNYVRARRPLVAVDKMPQRGDGLYTPRYQHNERRGQAVKEDKKIATGRSSGQMRGLGAQTSDKPETPPKSKEKRYYNCKELGHFKAECPMPILFADTKSLRGDHNPTATIPMSMNTGITRQGEVEGVQVNDLTLDTGSARTIVHSRFVDDTTRVAGKIPIRCAHGDTHIYPLAQVEIRVGEKGFLVEAAVSETLPVSVVLGRDVPELLDMLNTPEEPQDAMVVLTRAGGRRQAQVIQELEEGDSHSGATPTEIQQEPITSETEPADTEPVDVTDSTDALPFSFDDELFVSARPRERKSRRAKRQERHAHTDKACQT